MKERIDRLGTQGDCAGLQIEFDTAAANDEAQRDRVRSGNAALVSYIGDILAAADCY